MSRFVASVIVLIAFFAHQGYGQNQRKPVQPSQFNGQCEQKNGRYAVPGQCDAYVECTDGVPEEKLCDDGLLFNDRVGLFSFPCQYPIDVNCTTRARLQAAQPTDECPHQFGYYAIGDAANCGEFKNCANGRGYVLQCPIGLAFNKNTYQCDWPDLVPDCDVEAFLGFRCPLADEGFGSLITRFYKSDDCQRYFLCVNDKPRLNVCGVGAAFDEDSQACVKAKNIPGCEHLAIPEPEEEEPELAAEREPIFLQAKIKG